MRIVSYISQEIKGAFRIFKFRGYGRNDIATSFLATNFGEDYIPTKDCKMVQIRSTNSQESAIVCSVNKADKSLSVGEKVIYATDADGVIKASIHLRNSGIVEFSNGTDNAVRYSKLESEFNELKGKFNDLVTKYNAFAAAYAPGGPATQGLPPTMQQGIASEADITLTKIEEIKVP